MPNEGQRIAELLRAIFIELNEYHQEIMKLKGGIKILAEDQIKINRRLDWIENEIRFLGKFHESERGRTRAVNKIEY